MNHAFSSLPEQPQTPQVSRRSLFGDGSLGFMFTPIPALWRALDVCVLKATDVVRYGERVN